MAKISGVKCIVVESTDTEVFQDLSVRMICLNSLFPSFEGITESLASKRVSEHQSDDRGDSNKRHDGRLEANCSYESTCFADPSTSFYQVARADAPRPERGNSACWIFFTSGL